MLNASIHIVGRLAIPRSPYGATILVDDRLWSIVLTWTDPFQLCTRLPVEYRFMAEQSPVLEVGKKYLITEGPRPVGDFWIDDHAHEPRI